MKRKNLFALLIIIAVVPILSCGSQEESEESAVKEEPAAEQQAQKTDKDEKAEKAGKMDEDTGEMTDKSKEDEEDEEKEENADEESEQPDEELVAMGKETFSSKGCVACHSIGKGKLVGPDLLGVTERRETEWLRKWLKDPDGMLKTDPIAKEMLKEFMVPMPNQGLSDKEIEALIAYMKHEDQQNK